MSTEQLLQRRFALQFPSGNYFVSVDRGADGSLPEALTFNSEKHARWWFDKFAPTVWSSGGSIVPVMGDQGGGAIASVEECHGATP